ncbi:uncharacterized protein FOMMEDRAFT_165323 [Fomitiporia mediterranea MF3/22]|uniref:uncharacterized protein n=1 Tax=Fomitiporia mediterranea (strain MF3/22) TaxID=694068 RepID=UPI000440997E|nr:uncharacterized protein FOMMEDRAFT_165323 [Fomitiporia mediterranea MF3/22]EJD06556.1 hypothetical protein FOMMEDRAFT_165323 [Fomitiporia mediterranea MF3/22]
MSARQRFVASGKPSSKQPSEADGNEHTPASGAPAGPGKRDSNPGPPLKDASNSPRPGGRALQNTAQADKNKNETHIVTGSVPQALSTPMTLSVPDKPLNISNLTRPKARKAGDGTGTPSLNKKDKRLAVDRLKENDPISKIGSPRLRPMSPGRRPQNSCPPSSYLFNPPNAGLLANDRLISPESRLGPPAHLQDGSTPHAADNNQRYSRTHHPNNAASGLTPTSTFSPPIRRSYSGNLEPARSEVYPMRTGQDVPSEMTHTFSSLSPPAPAQRSVHEEHVYDYQEPINVDRHEGIDNPGPQAMEHRLRRTTKRIGQQEDDDEALHGREGKRTKIDMHREEAREIIVERQQIVDPSYERHARESTPPHRYQTPVQVNPHQLHQSHPAAHQHFEPPHAPNRFQLGEDNQALSRFLEVDLEHYVGAHIEKYEAAKKRWTDCSMEDWKAGAKEMSERFGKLVDFVKDHMTTKLEVHATLHEKVVQHKVVLSERQSMLKDKHERLVKNSGMVIGGNNACGL